MTQTVWHLSPVRDGSKIAQHFSAGEKKNAYIGGEEHQLRRTVSRLSAKPVDLYRSGFYWLCSVYFSVPHFSVSSPEFTDKLTERYRTER